MSSKKIERKRSLRSSGRKLCDTIILEADEYPEAKAAPSKITSSSSSSLRLEDTILVEETEDEDEENEDTLIAQADTTIICAKEQVLDATFLEKPAESEEKQLEEWSTIAWELPKFTGSLDSYLDNESKYSDEHEAIAVRTSLIETGDVIGIHSTFLANLYLSEWTDHNLNADGQVNLNVPEGARYMAKFSKILMSVTLKLVENSTEEPAHLHFKVNLENQNGKGIKSFVHFCTAMKNGTLTSILATLEKKDFAKMTPDDRLRITVECCVYRPPIEWGFSKDEIKCLTEIMIEGKVGNGKKSLVSKLVEKSRNSGLRGILDCLNTLIQDSFLEKY